MRTLVDIDEKVLREAMEVSNATTKKQTITLATVRLKNSTIYYRRKYSSTIL